MLRGFESKYFMTEKKRNKKINTLLLVEEGLKGTENQCLGILERLNLPFDHHNFRLAAPWSWLSPFLRWGCLWALTPTLPDKNYDLIIAAGRKAIAPALALKQKTGARTVFIQKPINAYFAKKFDLVIAPAHDGLKTNNAVEVIGSPNRVTPPLIYAAAQDFPELTALEGKKLAVLLGGTSKTHRFEEGDIKNLITALKAWNGSIMVTPSRRTPESVLQQIKVELADKQNLYIWDGHGANPLFGMMGAADHILVTSDSVSMISEGCSSGKPVSILHISGQSNKFDRFYSKIYEGKYAQKLDPETPRFHYSKLKKPLDDACKSAKAVEKLLSEA